MAPDSIAKINAPGQRRCASICVIFNSGKKTSDPANGRAQTKRDGKQISGTLAIVKSFLGPFNGNQSANKSADNRLTAPHNGKVVPMRDDYVRILQPIEQFASGSGAKSGSRYH